MDVRFVPGFGMAMFLAVLSLAGECHGAGEGTWHEWTIKRVDMDDQLASARATASVPTSVNPPDNESEDADPTSAYAYTDAEAQDGDSYAYGEMSSTAELNVASNQSIYRAIAKLTQSQYTHGQSTHQGPPFGPGTNAKALTVGTQGNVAGGEFDVDNPPLEATRTVIVAQMRFKAMNMLGQGAGSNGKVIVVAVGDSNIAAHYGGQIAPAGKWLLLGTLQTISGPQQINQVIDNPNDDLDVTFIAFQEVFHGTPFTVEVSDASTFITAGVPGDDPGSSTYSATVSGEASVISMYETEDE